MMRSLYSGVSGLRNHQTRMDVIGNNIANVNTVGFKAGRTIFQDMYSQNMRAASSPGETTGGTNPQQIGLGMTLSTIDTLFTRSAAQVTGSTYDLMIENDGFFVVRNGFGTAFEEFYTRAGNFYEDKEHYLVTANGYYLQGYKAALFQGDEPVDGQAATPTTSWQSFFVQAESATPKFSTKSLFANVTSPADASVNDKSYTITVVNNGGGQYTVTITDDSDPGNSEDVDVDMSGAASVTLSIDGVNITTRNFTTETDLLNLHNATVSFDNSGHAQYDITDHLVGVTSIDAGATNNNYRYEIAVTDAAKREIEVITYDADGIAIGRQSGTLPVPGAPGGDPLTRTVGDLTFNLASDYNIAALNGLEVRMNNDGVDAEKLGSPYYSITQQIDRIYVDENLYNVSIDKNGNVTGVVKKDGIIKDPVTGESIAVLAEQKVVIGRVVVATFDNQQGLEKVGSNLYRTTSNTGEAQYKSPGSDGAGQINPGALEMSNVDLAQEFTDMIVTQRGFQANSRIITVSDTLLEELVNLKR